METINSLIFHANIIHVAESRFPLCDAALKVFQQVFVVFIACDPVNTELGWEQGYTMGGIST